LRYVHVLALVVWLGGLIALGAVAAPAAFDVLQTRQGDQGRVLAGAVFGEILRRFHLVIYVVGAAALGTLVGMKLLGPRPVGFGLRAAVLSVMLGLALLSGTWVSGRIEALQREIGGPVSRLAPDDQRRVAFGRLHGLSTVLLALNVVGGLVLLSFEAKD
jgi:uncharacterized membrane protein